MHARLEKLVPRNRRSQLAVALVAAVAGGAGGAVLVAGGGSGPSADSAPGVADSSPGVADGSRPGRGQRRTATPARRASTLARELTLERKVAQLFALRFAGGDAGAPVLETLRRRDLGGLVVERENAPGPGALRALTAAARDVARSSGHVRPLLLAAQEGGRFNAIAGIGPETEPALLAAPSQGAVQARRAAPRLSAAGIDGVLAPLADVAPPGSRALGDRAFSDDAQQTARFAEGVIEAYREEGVISAAAHFPGLGSAAQDTAAGPAQVGLSEDELRGTDLVPFRAAIAAEVPAVVLSHGLYVLDDFVTPGSLSRSVATGLLRDDLDFEGVAITDDLTSPAVASLYEAPEAAVMAIRAGADMVQLSGSPELQDAAYGAVLSAALRGKLSARRLDEAVGRILLMKARYGLLDSARPAKRDDAARSVGDPGVSLLP